MRHAKKWGKYNPYTENKLVTESAFSGSTGRSRKQKFQSTECKYIQKTKIKSEAFLNSKCYS